MINIDNILFDLDGTLTDPSEGITGAVAYALAKRDIIVKDKKILTPFIGPPLYQAFEDFYGFDHEEAVRCVNDFREYYRPRGLYENVMYPGMPQMLEKLKAAGKRLLVATSKPEEFAIKILQRFELASYFDYIAGSTLDEQRIIKSEVITYCMEASGITDPESCIMVGDRFHDILGGKTCGMHTMGVLYGFGSREELTEAGADLIAEKVEDVAKLILKYQLETLC